MWINLGCLCEDKKLKFFFLVLFMTKQENNNNNNVKSPYENR
jgi:hypothetical protein